MKPLQLVIQPEEAKRTYKEATMKVRPNIYELVQEVSNKTGMTRIDIAGLMIEFAYDNIEFIKEIEED